MNRDRVEGLALLAFAVACWRGAYRVPPYGVSDPVGPTGFPIVLAAALGVAAAALIIQPSAQEARQQGRPVQIAVVFGLLGLYILLFERAGFALSTFLFLSTSIALFAPRWGWRIPIFAALLTGTLQLLFANGLGVALPPGPLWGR